MRVRGLLTVGVCALVLAGCTADKPEPVALTASPTMSQSPTPTPSPTPTGMVAVDMSDPDGVGIVFVDTPDLTGPEAAVHNAVAIYEVEHRRSMTTGTVSPLLRQVASPSLVGGLEEVLQSNAAAGRSDTGVLRERVFDIAIDGTSATASVCLDYTEALSSKNGGPPQTFEQTGESQFELITHKLSTFDDGETWSPQDFEFVGTEC